MTIEPKPLKIVLFIVFLVLASMACGLPKRAGEQGEGESQTSEIGQELDCEKEGYPCSYAEADSDILEDTFEIGDTGATMLNEGATMTEVAEWMATQDEIADVVHDLLALRFRLKDGPEFWLFNAALVEPDTKSVPGFAPVQIRFAAPPPKPFLDGPVGEEKPGKEPQKRALLLSPFLWQFRFDETDEIKRVLLKNRNYKCPNCVVRKTNEALPGGSISQGISIADFQSWEEFDIIHVSTHGSQICRGTIVLPPFNSPQDDCHTAILSGNFIVGLEGLAKPVASIKGVVWGRAAGWGKYCGSPLNQGALFFPEGDYACDDFVVYHEMLTADFFRNTYPGGLDDKLIFFSACASMKDSGLSSAIKGKNTIVLGWTESVNSGVAMNVSERFYTEFLFNGLRAEPAFEFTKEWFAKYLKNEADILDMVKGGGSFPGATVEIIRGGSPEPRGREVITWMHPVLQEELFEGDSVMIEGIAGDDEHDKMRVLFQIDGIDETQDPQAFLIHVSIDGEERPETFRVKKKVDEYSYWAEGIIDLPFDANDREEIKLDAWVDLPEGGRSRHVLENIKPAGCGWTAKLTGTRTGEIKGDLVLNLLDFYDVDPAIWEELGLSSGVPLIAETDEELPDTLILTGHPSTPSVMANDLGFIIAVFDGFGDAAMGTEVLGTLQFREQSDEHFEGSINATLVDGNNFGDLGLSAEFVWNAGSLCDIEMILAAAKNNPEGIDSP